MTLRSLLLSALVAFAIAQSAISQGRFPSDEDREKIRIRVGMTKEQQTQVEGIFNEERKLEGESRKRTGELYQQLQQNYDSYDNDKAAAAALRKEICKLYHDRIMIHANAQEKLRKVLTKDQFDRMTQMANEMREKWRKDIEARRNSRGPRPGSPPGTGPNP